MLNQHNDIRRSSERPQVPHHPGDLTAPQTDAGGDAAVCQVPRQHAAHQPVHAPATQLQPEAGQLR